MCKRCWWLYFLTVDHSRVKLSLITSKHDTSYINASFIKVRKRICVYTFIHKENYTLIRLNKTCSNDNCQNQEDCHLFCIYFRECWALGCILPHKARCQTLCLTSGGCCGNTTYRWELDYVVYNYFTHIPLPVENRFNLLDELWSDSRRNVHTMKSKCL